MIFATNDERNADLNAKDSKMRQKFSSIEDGEVRDDDDEEDIVQEDVSNPYAPQSNVRISESEVND